MRSRDSQSRGMVTVQIAVFADHVPFQWQRKLLCVLAGRNPDISHSPLIVEFIPLLLDHMSAAETFTVVCSLFDLGQLRSEWRCLSQMQAMIDRSKKDQWYFTTNSK